MRIKDKNAVQLLDIVTADLGVGDSRCIEASTDFPAFFVEHMSEQVFITSQEIHSPDEVEFEVTRIGIWHRAQDRTWILLALAPVYADDVRQTAPGATGILPMFAKDCRIQAAYAIAWLGIIIPFQQGGLLRIRDAVNGSRSA